MQKPRKESSIKENKWVKADVEEKRVDIDESMCPPMRFQDIFSLGEYNNIRTNLHSYGFGDIFLLNNHYCLPTFDSKIMIYSYA